MRAGGGRRVLNTLMISTERGARVEDFPALDVNRLVRGGFLAPGDYLWAWEEADGWPLRVISLGDRVEIRLLGATLGEVSLDSTPCHFGGRRLWWRCPSCDARRARLYLHGGVLSCRLCADLSYESQLEREVARGLRRARRIRERLGGSPRLVDPFPPKPIRMRWATYDALRTEAARAEADYLVSLAPMAKRVRRAASRRLSSSSAGMMSAPP